VYASSSSVYGDAAELPLHEDAACRPVSPYGVTKLAAEHLCHLYHRNHGLETVSLRFFTVYGPRQRPDMAMHRLLEAGLGGPPFPLYGAGDQVRDFTFVADVVAANLAAVDADLEPGTVVNVAGGGSTSLSDLVACAADVLGREIPIERSPAQPGDVARTGGSIERAGRLLGWAPAVGLREGLEAQARWHLARQAA
jgi:nucleoside-diphosphate-sugar epimerase